MLLKIPSNKDNDNDYTTAIVLFIRTRNRSGNTVPCQYPLQPHNSSPFTKTLTKMDAISSSFINKTCVSPNSYLPVIDSLLVWLQHGCKVT